MGSKSRNGDRIIDKKWDEIFQHFNILEKIDTHGIYEISSKTINEYKEARLMTKFDFINSLPDIFFENKLAILPITRGRYVIGKFKAYETIDDSNKAFTENRVEIPFPDWIETIDSDKITSEAAMLNTSFVSGMLKDFIGEETLMSTVSGRMSSNKFSYSINKSHSNDIKYQINVENSQLEIDGGYESPNNFTLIEAKNNITSSFLVRQLYYPYRLWRSKLNKNVLPVFLQYRNGIYNFSLYDFLDENDYSSLVLLKRKNYIIGDDRLTVDDIVGILKNTRYVEEPPVPFPQADSLDKVLEMVTAIYESDNGKITAEELTLRMDFVYRQAFYYSSAGIYLGLVEKDKNGNLILTNVGKKLNESSTREKNLILIKSIIAHEPFALVAEDHLYNMTDFSSSRVYQLVVENELLQNYSNETKRRRAQTIVAWVKKIFSMPNDY